jgi:hypothetical protein
MNTLLDSSDNQSPRRQSELLKHVSICIERLDAIDADITESYEDWRNVGFALANDLGEDGRPLFHHLSKRNKVYSFDETEKFYSDIMLRRRTTGKRISVGTLFMMFRDVGVNISLNEE